MGNAGDGAETSCPARNDIESLYYPPLLSCYSRYHHSLANYK